MSKAIQAIRGMNDILPDTLALWQRIERDAQAVLTAYGYREIRFPLVEKTELYVRSIGEVTDIVEKEMYTFEDRNGDMLTLRPEGTAGCVRAGIENGLLHNQVQRLWYAGPMFRHERPQKGRYRQFHQIGAEVFGLTGPDIDAELMILTARLWRQLGLSGLSLQINTLGTPACRADYRRVLVDYFRDHHSILDEDSRRRLDTNPLRILDSKNPALAGVIAGAPSLLDHLDAESRDHFRGVTSLLESVDVPYTVNPQLVRGLDYYTRTVFEWVSYDLGAQATVCAGGRYDGLVEQLGGRGTPAVGFALGLERLVELLTQAAIPGVATDPDVFLALLGERAELDGIKLAESLRDRGIRVLTNCGGGNLKTQLRRADRSGARYALLLGDVEIGAGLVGVKALREATAQMELPAESVAEWLSTHLS